MGSIERRERQKQQVRQKILDAARELFVARGYDDVTMRQIAQKIEYTPTAIYFHFADKQQLINELCAVEFLHLAQEMQHLVEIKDPVVRLKKMGMQYIEFGLKYPNHYRLMFMTPHPHIAPQDHRLIHKGNPSEDAYEFLRATILQCIGEGHFGKQHQDPELVSQVVWSCVHGFTSLYIARKHDPWIPWRPLRETANLLLDNTIIGLGGKAPAAEGLQAPAPATKSSATKSSPSARAAKPKKNVRGKPRD
ncbi:MAG TPA: TetR/AcrR family transcriptional regulator [Terriglobales bacterium]|nr:TetR/AcrR family transcriptional regulator [Terriglobales bacterium]